MKFAVLLPTHDLWGGVKRFLELGNRFIQKGHSFTLITPQGQKPLWFPFNGDTCTVTSAGDMNFDVVFCTENHFVRELISYNTKMRVFYHVLKNEDLRPILKHRDISVFVNSRNLYEYDKKTYGIDPFLAAGGVDTTRFSPVQRKDSDDVSVLTYGRLSMKRKGTRFIVKACERLYKKGFKIHLVLFDTPLNEKDMALAKSFSAKLPFEFILNHPVERTNELFQNADVFASAEKNAGWANTCAEAMACGLPVVATNSGSKDFLMHNKTGLIVWRNSWSIERAIRRLVQDKTLRKTLGNNARESILRYDWDRLCERILKFTSEQLRLDVKSV